MSLIVRMPTGGRSYAPPGTPGSDQCSLSAMFKIMFPGIAIASSLVTLGNPRKVSVDPTQKLEAEAGAKSRKSRKVVGVASGNAPTDL